MAYCSRMDKLCLEQSRGESLAWGLLINELSILILAHFRWAPLCARNFTNTATFHPYDHCYCMWSFLLPSKRGWWASVEPIKSPRVTELASGRAGNWTKVQTKSLQVTPQHLVNGEWTISPRFTVESLLISVTKKRTFEPIKILFSKVYEEKCS